MNNYKIEKSNTRKKGFYRDKAIEDSIDEFQALTVEQIYLLHFTDIKDREQGLIKVRNRLKELIKLKKIKYIKINSYGKPRVFYKKKPKHITFEHIVNRNWGYIHTMNCNNFFKLIGIRNEYVLGDLQVDGFSILYSDKGDKYAYWFIESDRENSKNEFDKIKIYNKMFKQDQYIKEDWADNDKLRPDNFPKILIVTDSMRKAEKIREKIKIENEFGLEFELKTVEEIKKELGCQI